MTTHHQVVIVGGGAGGIAAATSLKKRDASLDIAIVEPADQHFYQPGWTMVGAGVFSKEQTVKSMDTVWPDDIERIKGAVATFQPDANTVTLTDGSVVNYEYLVVAAGLKLDWDAVEGLSDTLGQNGVTSNYRFDLAPYTWKLVQEMSGKQAIFTQPPMPIKCAGAPQKAMYLSCDAWLKAVKLAGMNVSFCNAGPVLFGCAPYVPPLMEYVSKYGINLDFGHNLIKIDGPARTAWFKVTKEDAEPEIIERKFDMIHVCPPQCAPDFIAQSPLAGAGGWVDVDQATLQHTKFDNVFGLGDVTSTPNAKTAAAARKQAPIVAQNLIAQIRGAAPSPLYDGYGSCPLTVENGKIILAEFGYGGKVMPSFPWDSTKPRRSAWFLKKSILPWVYWNAMLKGREWLTKSTAG
ncbi:NAD(P)/FAD-dependent oxidoreductase [Ruegeria atlantica]|uniref:Sulfide dehydrogenase [flavocytochrome c] flavoprotein chain n=1 Tax=Ruegeria atlantica TaxID=81569 RepID=A0A0N7LQS1_9RHOB|nr:FAD/NAD(P)-binding oxidoreductase [Ruegeria atlantica]CUH45831.1 Sulfide dehydrogenase [flavocytochrome c] flavoprotein chain precursor [Ruegeria atlantica]CUH48804.1 Sulfide dehydrogenase [flavocytochrome c] flavoprotein chain precursor [Ruegeria atlantica]